jgi:hypothetical protein
MDRRQQLLGAFTLGVIAAALVGCGDTSAYKAYTPADEAAPAPASSVASDPSAVTPTEVSPAAETPPAAVEPVAPVVAEATPSAEPVVASPEPVAEPAAPVDVSAARPEEIPSAADPGAVTPASALEPDGTLIAAIGNAQAAAVALEPRETKLLIPEKSFQREGDTIRLSYDDIDLLKVLNMEPVVKDAPDKFPQWLKDLEGQRIHLRGYMRPGELSEDLPFFVMARDMNACCFGPNTKPYDIIPVMMREGVTTDWIAWRPFDITGVFHIDVAMDFANEDKVEFLYYVDDAVIVKKK